MRIALGTRRATEPGPPNRPSLLVIGGVVALALLVPIGTVLVVFTVAADPPAPPARRDPPAGSPVLPGVPPPGDGGWDVAAQTALASRPMLRLPESAALPHRLTSTVAGPPIDLPPPTGEIGVLPSGYPGTVEGAVAQLITLTGVGLEGGDPQGYRLAYQAMTLPGAPPVEQARLYRDLQRVRAGVRGLPPTGAVPGLVFSWTPTSALVKGGTDGGRYVVVCVLGELVAGINGQSISTGAGDCQALRRVGDRWWVSPGVPAAPAALAWPGSVESVMAGYRAVRR